MGSPPHMRGKAWTMPISTSITSDHPRICGEKVVELVPDAQRQGSPPHMRGKALNTSFVPELYRITPAYAGKSSELKESASIRRDHPRICGEKYLEYGRRYKSTGSPPHMRGKEEPGVPHRRGLGITPAYAGKSLVQRFLVGDIGDHPRICGEKKKITINAPEVEGSPPHMRGKVQRFQRHDQRRGITPAYAGKSNTSTMMWCSHWDHPRICGEKYRTECHQRLCEGITPAYAGKRFGFSTISTMSRDHPRICGEKWSILRLPKVSWGSPPHMRGKDQKANRMQDNIRITPAYAGKSTA